MKKIIVILSALFILFGYTSCTKKVNDNSNKKQTKIGIAKIVQHEALDNIEKGIIDVVTEAGFDAKFDLQNANGDPNTAVQIASKFKSEKVDVAVGIATPIAVALATAIKDTPVVFGAITDPIGAGLVSSLDKGENNITGMSDAIPTKEHILLFAKIANLKTLGYIYTSNEANSISALELVKEGCKLAGIELVTQSISTSAEVRQAAEVIVKRCDGIYLTTDNTVFSALPTLVQVFGNAKKPIFSGDVTGAMQGGIFMATGFNYYKAGRATGELVVRILKGEKPTNIPVKFMTDPSDSDLLIDLDACNNCGIKLPAEYISKADYIYKDGKLETTKK